MRGLVSFVLFFLFALPAQACMCFYDKNISDFSEEVDAVFLASPVGTNFVIGTFNKQTATRFKVWKTYQGITSGYVDLDVNENTSCAATFPMNQSSIIVTRKPAARTGVTTSMTTFGPKSKSSKVEKKTDYCTAYLFSRQQWLDYFELDIDAPSEGLCLHKIKRAYDTEVSVGAFKLDEKCKVFKKSYDAKFRVKIIED
ncbi:hypothetical protein ACJ3XI_10765 [Litorimonas sp. RW-G-Af-16]|uniref:hypothetical protein n=1 Tax=Litorimonas sp. RW-G-Af-16 TaxID=3241168 RepID=UPI00390C554A